MSTKNLFPNKITFIGSRDLMIFLLRSLRSSFSFFFFWPARLRTILGWQLLSLSSLKVVSYVSGSGFCHFCFFEISISLPHLMYLCFYCEMTRCDFILCLFCLVLTSCLTLASFKNFFYLVCVRS